MTTVAAIFGLQLIGADAVMAQPGLIISVGPGTVQRNDAVISPPVVPPPLYTCGTTVRVDGVIQGATVTVMVDGPPPLPPPIVIPDANATGLDVSVPPLVTDQRLWAMQELPGVSSGPSEATLVVDHTAEYPLLPSPRVDPTPVYECGEALASRGQLPGSVVDVLRSLGPPRPNPASTNWTQVYAFGPVFRPLEELQVQYSLCGDFSAPSVPILAAPNPASIPAVTVPKQVLAGEEWVRIDGTLPGARVEFRLTDTLTSAVEPSRLATGFRSTAGRPAARLGRAIRATDELEVWQELCAPGPPTMISVVPCTGTVLEAPVIDPPAIGDDFVRVASARPDARVEIFDGSGTEIGDGAAPRVALYRPLVAGDVLRARQRIGECTSDTAYEIPVRCNPWRTIPSPLGSGPYDVAAVDYDETDAGSASLPDPDHPTDPPVVVPLRATIRYPVDGDGVLARGSGRRLPLFVIQHGQHRPFVDPTTGEKACENDPPFTDEVESFRGYDYLLEALARRGFIAVSMDVNPLVCNFQRELWEGLFRSHLSFLEDAALPGASALGGAFAEGIDFDSVVLAGHSSGAVTATAIAADTMDSYDVHGVLSLAGVDPSGTSLAPGVPLLIINGSDDGCDTANTPANQYSNATAMGSSAWFKAWAHLYYGNHNFFNSEWPEECLMPSITRGEQEQITTALSVEFASEVVGQTSALREVARGRARYAGIGVLDNVDGGRIYWSFQEAGDQVIDAFAGPDDDTGTPTTNRLGLPVSSTSMDFLSAWISDSGGVGARSTQAAFSGFSAGQRLLIEALPTSTTTPPLTAGLLDYARIDTASFAFAWLPFPGHGPLDAEGLRVRLKTGSADVTVELADAGRVFPAHPRTCTGTWELPPQPPNPSMFSMPRLIDVRVPLQCAGVTPTEEDPLTEISIEATTAGGEAYIDDVLLAETPWR
jgi:hypothetical protein